MEVLFSVTVGGMKLNDAVAELMKFEEVCGRHGVVVILTIGVDIASCT